MSDFSGISLGVKLGIVLGCLLAATFVAGGIKAFLNKRRLNRKRIEEADRPADKEKLVQKEFNEGNLFGVRAIQHGFYGGVAQRPSSPSPSYLLAPDAPLVDWSKEGKPGSSASSISSFPQARMKPSPLRLEVQDPKYNPSGVGGIGGSYMPPLPSPRSNRVESPMFNEPKPSGWISPLDVHFSRPATPQPYRPTSYLPKLNLDFEQSGMLMPTSNEVKSEAASIESSEVTTPAPAVLKSPLQSAFSSQLSTVRAAQKSLRSMFPTDEHSDELGSPKGSRFESPPVPLKDLSSKMTSVDPNQFPQDNRQWNLPSPGIPRDSVKDRQWKTLPAVNVAEIPINNRWGFSYPTLSESRMQSSWGPASSTVPDSVLDAEWDRSRPVIRDSAVSKQRVSVVRPARASQIESVANRDQRRRLSQCQSATASSLYSNETSILETEGRAKHERVQSHAADFDFSHNRTQSGTTKRSSPARSLTRTRDSVRHSRSISDGSLIRLSRGQSRTKATDQIHEPPFSNSHATSNNSHSASSSFSSYLSTTKIPRIPSTMAKTQPSLPDLENFPFPASTRPPPPRGFEFALPPIPADHLKAAPDNHGRSTSEASQASISDFYDSYYRRSGVAQAHGGGRDSVQAQIQGFNSKTGASGKMATREPPRRPAPLNLSKLGQKYVGDETIAEVATPNTGHLGQLGARDFLENLGLNERRVMVLFG